MNENTIKEGYVYILDVKDIELPVCKIGMTTRSPFQRCNEINNSSTGDLIWEVSHYIAVDDCKSFESLIHSKLDTIRQKRREFFNINANEAYEEILSILDAQSTINKIAPENTVSLEEQESKSKKKKGKRNQTFRRIDQQYAELLHAFASILGVKGRPFGQLNRPVFGISDGNEGVQWNLAVHTDKNDAQLGVNLEGSAKTGKWLIAPFVLSEPNIETLKAMVDEPECIYVRFTRDAWQGASRLNIKEKYLGDREHSLSELDQELWDSILDEALGCLDENKGYRGRKKEQKVTLVSDGREVIKDVSPHLTIWTRLSLEGDIVSNISDAITKLKPAHDWVVGSVQS